jgi:ABC-type bacteriocin/lantibiotic exporter with double-glycine peptidase domain
MSDEKKDILSGLNKDIEQEKLLEYLNRNMSDEAQHAFEKQMNEDEFMYDAVEGLEEVKNKQHLELVVQQLNNDLKKQVERKKKRKQKRKLREQPSVYFAVILILLLTVIAYLVIKRFN